MGFEPVTSANTGAMLYQLSYEAYRCSKKGASSCEPGRLNWLDFQDLACRLFSSKKKKNQFLQMRSRAASVTEISDFATEICIGDENFSIRTIQPW